MIDLQLQNCLRDQASNPTFRKGLMVFRNQRDNIFFSSFRKSGGTWTISSLMKITGLTPMTMHPARRAFGGLDQKDSWISIDLKRPYILNQHNPSFILPRRGPNDKFILLVRNYFECMSRGLGGFDKVFSLLTKNLKSYYFEGIRVFDSWDSDKRLLIYYEDLIVDFEKEMRRAIDFLDVDDELLNEFMLNYDDHKERVLQSYSKMHGKPVSKGNDLLFHTRNIPRWKLKTFENAVKTTYPNLWEKYLSRYAVDDR